MLKTISLDKLKVMLHDMKQRGLNGSGIRAIVAEMEDNVKQHGASDIIFVRFSPEPGAPYLFTQPASNGPSYKFVLEVEKPSKEKAPPAEPEL